jgi:mono/diheme cytochrome c family protein
MRPIHALLAATVALAGSAIAQHKPIIPPLPPGGKVIPEIRMPGEIKVIPTMPKPGELPVPIRMPPIGSGTSTSTVTPVVMPYTPNVEAGKQTFGSRCIGCHLASGKGVAGHELREVVKQRDYESLVAFLKKPTGDMPKFYPEGLTENDVRDVAKYVHEHYSKPEAAQ